MIGASVLPGAVEAPRLAASIRDGFDPVVPRIPGVTNVAQLRQQMHDNHRRAECFELNSTRHKERKNRLRQVRGRHFLSSLIRVIHGR